MKLGCLQPRSGGTSTGSGDGGTSTSTETSDSTATETGDSSSGGAYEEGTVGCPRDEDGACMEPLVCNANLNLCIDP